MRRRAAILLVGILVSSTAGCGSAAVAAVLLLRPKNRSTAAGTQQTPPTVYILSASQSQGRDVTITYILIDQNSNPVDITVEFSTDGGANWKAATEATSSYSHGVSGLSASPGGDLHIFVWDADNASDLPGYVGDATVRITPSDASGQGVPAEVTVRVDNNSPPTVSGVAPQSNPAGGSVTIDYTLTDAEGDSCSITVEYSVDNGTTWQMATEGTGGDGVSNLSSSTTGVAHTFVWDTLKDLGYANYTGVIVRITPADTKPGNAKQSAPFDVNNNEAPSVAITTPSGEQSGNVAITYTLYDSNSDPVDIEVQWYDPVADQWNPATQAGGDSLTGLSSSPSGVSHVFVWDSLTDFGTKFSDQVKFKIRPSDATAQGNWVESDPFIVANNKAPSASVPTPASPQTASVTILYTLTDDESDLCNIRVEYTTDGVNWQTTSEDTSNPNHEGVSGLSSSPTGVQHTFVWDAQKDLDGQLVTTVQVRVVPSDTYREGTAGISAQFTVDATHPPQVSVTTPTSPVSGPVSIEYTLTDDESQKCSITVEYSRDQTNWYSATKGTGGDDTVNLSSSPSGVPHTFVWDTLTDNIGKSGLETVYIRITVSDTKTGNTAQTGSFDVNNAAGIPYVSVTTPTGEQSGDVPIQYSIDDPDGDICSIEVQFWDGTTWQNASRGSGGDPTTNLSTPGNYTFSWDSLTDLGPVYTTTARVRIRPYDGTNYGSWVSTGFFTVANNEAPSVSVTTPTSPASDSVEISYTLYDDESDNCDIIVEWSEDGTNWKTATEDTSNPNSEGTKALSASPSGAQHKFYWDTNTDIGHAAKTVRIRIRPFDPYREGASGTTDPFQVKNMIDITWTGDVSSNWDDANNWSGGTPSDVANITIPAGRPNYPVLKRDETILSITIEDGANLTLKGDIELHAEGNVTVAGQLVVDSDWSRATIHIDGNLTVTPTGVITASGKGYPSGVGLKVGVAGSGGDGGGGGGHGGYGGWGDNWAEGGAPYDSATKPSLPGSGGAPGNGGSAPGGTGGGAIKIDVGGTFQLDGVVEANGADGVDGGGGGAGGSIWVDCDVLTGGGHFEANGGDASGSPQGGGGGGGRIAIHYNDVSNFTGTQNCSVSGGSGANDHSLSYGSILFICKNNTTSTADDDLYIYHNSHIIDTYLAFRNITINDNTTVVLNSYEADRATCLQITLHATDDMEIRSGAVITATGLGYRPSEGPGAGADNPYSWGGDGKGSHGGGHGGYGGMGDNLESEHPGVPYDSMFQPSLSGSGGGLGDHLAWGGAGGGAIKIEVGRTLTLDGEICADGTDAPSWDKDSGGGAGGSIWLSCNTLIGSGFCTAEGGNGSDDGGGGAGGIIVVYYEDDSNFKGHPNFSVAGGARGGAVGNTPYGDGNCGSCLFVNTKGTTSTDDDEIHIYTYSRVTESFTCGSLYVHAGAALFIDSFAAATKQNAPDPVQITITVNGDINVDSDARIVGTGLGYIWSSGPGAGEDDGGGAGGGGYGGAGGDGGGGSGGQTYGDANAPTDCGSGGGSRDRNDDSKWGARGGASLKLDISGSLTMDGFIRMDGENAAHNRCGGGAGGSVWIICNVLTGSGTITANGGKGKGGGGGGGGGRIKIETNDSTGWSGTVQASGGQRGGAAASDGQDGTVVGP